MTAIEDSQKQDPGSELIVLFELEVDTNNTLYFSPMGMTENLGGAPADDNIQFRDSAGAIKTYVPFPISVQGFDISSDGSYNRPVVSIANLENTVKLAINDDFESLVGKRITRRTTFRRYLVDGPGDSTPPVELPKQVYIIDRIKSKNVLTVEFELATPYDLAGIQLPRRVIVGGACPFKYKGASDNINFYDRVGGCNWKAEFRKGSSNLFMTRNDEYILPSTLTFNSWTGTAVKTSYYTTTETTPAGFYKVSSEGVLQAANRVNYWQALKDQTGSAPSDTDKINWRRVRVFTTYNSSNSVSAYKDSNFNDYVIDSGVLWRTQTTQTGGSHQPLQEGPYWTTGDVCGKTLKSCRLRFYAGEDSPPSGSVRVSSYKSSTDLPFGGFPGATQRR